MKYLILIPLLCFFGPALPQRADTAYLKKLYDRCLGFDESKADSLDLYANFISSQADRLHYNLGPVLSGRLKGIAQDLRGEYDKAIVYYFQCLDAARRLHATRYEISAFTDLGYVYVNTKQPARAKAMYLQSARLSEEHRELRSVATAYLNLGAIYNQLKVPDSALYYLSKGLALAALPGGKNNLSSFYNNIGNVYYQKKEYTRSLSYFRLCHQLHAAGNNESDLWLDNLNIADVFIEMKNYDSGYVYAQRALQLALKINARSKQADSYAMLAKLYSRQGDYKKAWDFQQQWYAIDTSLVNSSTNETIASLQERYNARQREQENKLLQSEVEKARFRNRAITLLALAALAIAAIIGLLLVQKRKVNARLQFQNECINRQNEKLAELNYQKNSLISVVSHDLSTPFSAIRMWLNILTDDASRLTAEQEKSVERIRQSAMRGESLIRSILDIEKVHTNQHTLQLERLDLAALAESVATDFEPAATGKSIRLLVKAPARPVWLVSDRQLLIRICENLLSNAIKYSPPGKKVWINLSDTADTATISIADEGPGIPEQELPLLFSRYGRLSATPTAGEASTGLGLSIVQRLVQELDGTVSCTSTAGKGAVFTVVLKK